jgi:hypothetical protein
MEFEMKVGILFNDYALSIYIGRHGITIGPWFLTIDRDGDIAHQLGNMAGIMCEKNFVAEFYV